MYFHNYICGYLIILDDNRINISVHKQIKYTLMIIMQITIINQPQPQTNLRDNTSSLYGNMHTEQYKLYMFFAVTLSYLLIHYH